MSIEAINEQLLRAIGVGVALVDMKSLGLEFRNDTFLQWFGDTEKDVKLPELFPSLEPEALRATLDAGERYTAETSFKLKRRTTTVALEFSPTNDQGRGIAVLVCQNITRIKELESMIESYSMTVERNTHEIKREKEQVEKLLLNMMPRSAYEEYKSFGVVTPRLFDSVSVLTLDFSDFSGTLHSHDPSVIVSELNDIFTAFDRIGEQFACERIRTSGNVYFAVAGVPDPVRDHAGAAASAAVRFLRYVARRNASHPIKWNVRIGIASGAVIGSVVGSQRYIYDVFGPAVNDAISTKSLAEPMSVAAHDSIADLLDNRFVTSALAAAGPAKLLNEASAEQAHQVRS